MYYCFLSGKRHLILGLFAIVMLPGDALGSTIAWVRVGDPGNAARSPYSWGSVAEEFQIMRFEFTNAQYVEFLNSVDPQGTNPNSIFASEMTQWPRGGITNTGTTNGSRYAVKANMADKPVNYVSWFDAARVANWLHHGGLSYGTSDASASAPHNTGAYTLGSLTSGTAPGRNSDAKVFIPTRNQWYKAAYYKGGSTNAGWWEYATQSDIAPEPSSANSIGVGLPGGTGNFANYSNGADWNSLNGNLTTVGTNGAASAYGTFDMNGNVTEWADYDGNPGTFRDQVGGNWNTGGTTALSSRNSLTGSPSNYGVTLGFRLAAPVPEPSTYAMLLVALTCSGCKAFSDSRRRGGRLPTTRSVRAGNWI